MMFDDIIKNLKNKFSFNNSNMMRNNRMTPLGFRTRNRGQLNYKLIPYEQARNMIESGEALLVDVRSNAEFENMHIRNAINIPVNDVEKEILSYDRMKNIIVYCATGTRSKSAIQIFNSLGYSNVYIWEYAALSNFPYKDMIIYRQQ